jgi:hypothetical protein
LRTPSPASEHRIVTPPIDDRGWPPQAANDELGYIIPKAEWDSQAPWLQNKKDRWYGEVNSAGEEVAGAVTRALVRLMEQE